MKFLRNKEFDGQFDQLDLTWYPYIGRDFGSNGQRLMVFAHNIPAKPLDYEAKAKEWTKAKGEWADALDEYTYVAKNYTKSFRFFIKGAVGLSDDYMDYSDPLSDPSITDKVDSFVWRIAYGNFIQALVKNENQCATAVPEDIHRSKVINQQILKTLGITHCICWGKPVFEYVTTMDGYQVLKSENLSKPSFGYALVQNESGSRMHLLKVHHPCRPQGFGPFTAKTHNILAEFLAKPNP